MVKAVEVIYDNEQDKLYFEKKDLDLKKNINLIVKDSNGYKYVIVNNAEIKINKKELNCKFIRIATSADYKKNRKNKIDAEKALKKCNQIIEKEKMNMNLVSAYYTFDKKQLIFKFISDERVDFRSLAKTLANIYKTRIELRQIGVRDKAKIVGGCGQCGRELCCKKFLNNFESVSINMAKNQNISLNPNKINGCCGRLLCCLQYEDDCYKYCRKKLPFIGKNVETSEGIGKVKNLDILKLKYTVELENGKIVECDINESN